MKNRVERITRLCRLAPLLMAALPALAIAQTYEFDINSVSRSEVIEQEYPQYPSTGVKRGQEGWVRMSFVVTPEGRAVDPLILNSSGGYPFEHEARQVVSKWRFAPSESGSAWNFVDIRSEIRRSRDEATTRFGRSTASVGQHIENGDIAGARSRVDAATAKGGWNLYESTILWLMTGRVAGLEGNDAEKLESYRRALAMGNSRAIPTANRLVVLEWVFELQAQFGQYAAAATSHDRLQRMNGSEGALLRTAARAAEVDAQMQSDEPLAASAVIYNPCDCDDGEPIWHYAPARRTFSFANTSGNVERFEARCEAGRLQDSIEDGESWTLAPEWGTCRVMVFGDDGATFDFIEHGDDGADDAAETAVARNHVLDKRDRSQ